MLCERWSACEANWTGVPLTDRLLLLNLHSAKDIKHKISFLLQKPEPQAAEQKQSKEKAAAAKRSEEELRLC